MSDRLSALPAVSGRDCSGDMYQGVPAEVVYALAASSWRAMPKSASTSCSPPPAPRRRRHNTLLGLRSRWIMPASWATAQPSLHDVGPDEVRHLHQPAPSP